MCRALMATLLICSTARHAAPTGNRTVASLKRRARPYEHYAFFECEIFWRDGAPMQSPKELSVHPMRDPQHDDKRA